ncbi:hypothetical protein LAV_00172 [Sphingobium phage Lacusarx]|uniref:Uncharacterized protein n=1 Tax=Sphingobium phage Lacusarx TaxID=1980139 RepID=A0A1W6DX05_9CAUD|nr:hypothetical protein FDH44_gp131 [Sphingobium phage Lacusarx]ARK07547.1 hypothetical protein LAV_00172 [Sphingobium phage Lacusarx]
MLRIYNPDNIRARTAELRLALAPAPATPEQEAELTPRIAAIVEALSNNKFGCQERNVRSLVEAIIGEPLPIIKKPGEELRKEHILGSIIWFNDDEELLLVRAIDRDGDADSPSLASGEDGSSSYVKPGDDWRAATEEEVEAYLIEAGLINAPAEAA